MKTVIAIFSLLIISSIQAKGFKMASCSLIDELYINGQEVIYFTVDGGGRYGSLDRVREAEVNFYGDKMKLIASSEVYKGEYEYVQDFSRYSKVTLKENFGDRRLKFRVTRHKVISHLDIFETGYKGVEADCELF